MFILFCSIQSCASFIYKRTLGIKKPKQHEEAKILREINKRDFDKYPNYGLSEEGLKYVVSGVRNYQSDDILVFNSQGELMLFIDTLSKVCRLENYVWLRDIGDTTQFKPMSHDSLSFNYISKYFVDIDGSEADVYFNEDKDYTIVMLWASFMNRWNDRVYKRIEDHDSLENISIDVIMLNWDLRDFHDFEKLDTIKKQNKTNQAKLESE